MLLGLDGACENRHHNGNLGGVKAALAVVISGVASTVCLGEGLLSTDSVVFAEAVAFPLGNLSDNDSLASTILFVGGIGRARDFFGNTAAASLE